MGIGATHIDHIVISSNDSATVARTFSENFGIEIKRTMVRPGTSAQLSFAKLQEVVLEFAGPPEVTPGDEVKAKLWGLVLAVSDICTVPLRACAASVTPLPTHQRQYSRAR